MKEHKGRAKRAFWRTVNNEPQENEDKGRVPKMIEEDRPTLKPKPPAIGRSIDAQSFNKGCMYDLKTHQQVSTTKENSIKDPLTTQFNRKSDPLDQITDKKRDRGLGR